jgi:hypothetical protein
MGLTNPLWKLRVYSNAAGPLKITTGILVLVEVSNYERASTRGFNRLLFDRALASSGCYAEMMRTPLSQKTSKFRVFAIRVDDRVYDNSVWEDLCHKQYKHILRKHQKCVGLPKYLSFLAFSI